MVITPKSSLYQFSQSFLTCQNSQAFNHLCGPLWALYFVHIYFVHIYFVQQEPKLNTRFEVRLDKHRLEQDNNLVISACDDLDATNLLSSFCATAAHWSLRLSFVHQVLSHRAAPQMGKTQPLLHLWSTLFQVFSKEHPTLVLAGLCEVLTLPAYPGLPAGSVSQSLHFLLEFVIFSKFHWVDVLGRLT